VLDGIRIGPDAEVLEIGCGVGRLLVPFSERVARAHGVDISEVMIQKSKDYVSTRANLETSVTDGTLSAFADASFDFVFSFIVFQHIPERAPIRTYVEEAGRVLRPGGLFRFQVDGRWWWPDQSDQPGWQADTYNGIKFSPDEVRALLHGTELETVDEWGEEGHYHWVTARKRAPAGAAAAPVTLSRREFDPAILLRRLNAIVPGRAAEIADEVIGRRLSVWRAVQPLLKELVDAPDDLFVREAMRRLLGREPDPDDLEVHLSVLSSRFEDRAGLVDTVLTGRGFRDLVQPVVPELPWQRLEAVLAAMPELSASASFFDVVDAAERRIRARAVDEAYALLLGERPNDESVAYYVSEVDGRADGLRLVTRELLGSPEGRILARPLSDERIQALARRCGVPLEGRGQRSNGESFPGEARLARFLLQEMASLSESDFVKRAYERILGRAVDADGERFYTHKLGARELTRPAFLRDLLWSDELRET
jgi:SAM-dependent methyltransferase